MNREGETSHFPCYRGWLSPEVSVICYRLLEKLPLDILCLGWKSSPVFIHGLFEGVFVLFLLIAAHRSGVWEDIWLHLPLLRWLGAVFQARCFCFQVRFNQTRILNSCYSKDGPRRSRVSIAWQLVRNAGSGATRTNEPDLVLKEPQCFMGTFMLGSAVCVTPYLSQLWP